MKIVVVGGSGLIGSKLVNKLRQQGHEAVAAARFPTQLSARRSSSNSSRASLIFPPTATKYACHLPDPAYGG